MLYPSKHGNGAKETLLCLLLKITDWIGTQESRNLLRDFIVDFIVCLQMKRLGRTGAGYAKPIMYSVVQISEWTGAKTG